MTKRNKKHHSNSSAKQSGGNTSTTTTTTTTTSSGGSDCSTIVSNSSLKNTSPNDSLSGSSSSSNSTSSSSVLGGSNKSIGMVPSFHQNSIKFAPCNEKLKDFLVHAASDCYDTFTDVFGVFGEESLFANLSTPQQLNMVTNYIVNYVCLDVNGSVLTRKFVQRKEKDNMQSVVFDKEAYLNDPGDKLNSFISLRHIISIYRGKLEMEIDVYGWKERKAPSEFDHTTVDDVMKAGIAFSEKERGAVKQALKGMKNGEKDYSFGDFKSGFNTDHDHVKCGKKIFTTYFEDIPPEKRDPGVDDETRFYVRKKLANALKATIPISKFNETLFRCQDMDLWLTVLELIFNGFVTSFNAELFYFVETDFDPLNKGWTALLHFVDQNTRLFKKIYKPYMFHRDLNKLQYLFIENEFFCGQKNEKAANFIASITDYNEQVFPKRKLRAFYSSSVYILTMVKNGLNFNVFHERLRGFLETFKYHKENKMAFLNIFEPESIKVSNNLKPIQNHQPVCSCCGKHKDLKMCSKCNAVHYCSLKCQSMDWPEHKQVCSALSSLMSLSNDELKIFVRQNK